MLTPARRKLPSSLVILRDESRPNQKWLGDVTDRSGRKSKDRCQDIEPSWAIGEQSQILLLDRTKAKSICLFQQTRSIKMSLRDDHLAFRTSDTTARLKQTQCKTWRSSRSLCDER